jgi:hypothetical protein
MKHTDSKGRIHQVMHAVFNGSLQLTTWRPCRVATIAALHRSSHHTKRDEMPYNKASMTRPTQARGALRVRDRVYHGLTLQSKVFITPARTNKAAA